MVVITSDTPLLSIWYETPARTERAFLFGSEGIENNLCDELPKPEPWPGDHGVSGEKTAGAVQLGLSAGGGVGKYPGGSLGFERAVQADWLQ